ncbi:MAG: hypothetical protein HC811_04480 [Flammeovirgaceae bacterium]|nr:hypothetical protein [Flammeovirgaceae bacterium]
MDAAAAYSKAGQPEAAKALINDVTTAVKPYQEMSYSYGSDLRDKAIILETLLLLGEKTKGFDLLKEISAALSNQNMWMSTQTTAWCLKAASAFAGSEKRGELSYSFQFDGKEINAKTGLSFAQSNLPVEGAKSTGLNFTNRSNGSLFVRVISEGTPARDTEGDVENGLKLSVSYLDLSGNPIDPSMITQTTSFKARVVVGNPGLKGHYKNVALTQIFPSGWEINNLRLDDVEPMISSSIPIYQDIRDDRVLTYFDLNVNQNKTFEVTLTASYVGTYFLPSVSCEAMYDQTVFARKKGMEVNVMRDEIE